MGTGLAERGRDGSRDCHLLLRTPGSSALTLSTTPEQHFEQRAHSELSKEIPFPFPSPVLCVLQEVLSCSD